MKNTEKCEKIMDEFLMLDKKQALPVSVCLHLLACKECRTRVRLMTMAEKKLAEPMYVPLPLSDEKLAAIMKKVDPDFCIDTVCPVSFSKWIIAGIALILAIVFYALFGFNAGGSSGLTLLMYVFFGVCITLYCSMFIGSNLDFFVKNIDAIKPLAAHQTTPAV